MRYKTSTGCRPAQLIGLWLIEPGQFRQLYDQAMRVDLVALGIANRAAAPGPVGPDDDDDEQDDDAESSMPYQVVNGIAHLMLTGPMTKLTTSFQAMMGGTATAMLRRNIRLAAADPNVIGAVLHIDSPGGTVDGTQALANDIAAFAKSKPIMAFIDGCGCSAAYWAASQCTSICASPTSLVGSIGTRMRLEDSSGKYEQKGVVVHEITTGPMKAAGAPGTKVTADQVAYYQKIADDTQMFFSGAVQSSRKMTDDQMKAISDGSVMLAGSAKAAGLVDTVCDEDAAIKSLYNAVFFGASA